MKRISHAEFIKLCQLKGIDITKITRKYIQLPDAPIQSYWWPENVAKIVIDLSAISGFEMMTIPELVATKNKIQVIKEIRRQTGMGLKDAVNFVNANFFDKL